MLFAEIFPWILLPFLGKQLLLIKINGGIREPVTQCLFLIVFMVCFYICSEFTPFLTLSSQQSLFYLFVFAVVVYFMF